VSNFIKFFLTRSLGGIVIAAALAGCQDRLQRHETVSLDAGDAIAWNKAVHTIDPWPRASADTRIPVSGRRVARAIEAYENGGVPPGEGAPPPITLVPMAPFAPGANGAVK
jgi:hypothetical protein